MKHLKIFENNRTVQSIRKMAEDYMVFLHDIKPFIFEKYYKLANDPNYETEYGDELNVNDKELALTNIGYYDGGLQFHINSYDNNGEIMANYYIDITNDELEEMLIKLDSKKYNL